MKIWLPDSLYRVKPLLLLLFGAALLFISDSTFLSMVAFLCMGYGSWILVIRLMWSTSGTIKTRAGPPMAGEERTHVVNLAQTKSR